MNFSAAPKINGNQRPPKEILESIAKALVTRGCTILRVGRFAVSAQATEEVFRTLEAEKGQGDLLHLDTLYAPTPPTFFS